MSFVKTPSVLLISLCVLLLTACSVPARPRDEGGTAELEPVKLQLRWLHQFQFAGYYAAIEQGYYRDAGIDVELVEGDPKHVPDPATQVTNGAAQYGVGTSDLLVQRGSGAPVVALASIFQHSPYAIGVRADRGISSPQELTGATLVMQSTPRTAELQAMLVNEGVDLDTIRFVQGVPFPGFLFDEQYDGWGLYQTNEPYLLDQAGIPITLFEPRSYGIDFYGDLLYTSEAELRDHPDRVRRFRDASLRGWEYAMTNPEEIIEVIETKYASVKSHEALAFEAQAMQELILPKIVEMGHMNPGRWQHIADTYASLGMLPESFALDAFLYNPDAPTDHTMIYLTSAIVAIGLLATALAAMGLTALNHKLRRMVRLRTAELEVRNLALQREIEERHAAVAALHESEGRFRAVWESSTDAMVLSDAESLVIAANPAYYELYGLTPEQTIGNEFSVIFPTEQRAWAQQQYQVIYQLDEPPPGYETEIQHSSGARRIVESHISFISQDGMRVAMLSTIRDITERIRREAENYRQSQILNAVGQAIVTVDMDGCVTYWNKAAETLLGWTSEDARGQKLDVVAPAFPAVIEPARTIAPNVTRSRESTVQSRDGNWRPCLVTQSPLLDAAGVVTGVIFVYSDLTELKQMEARFREAQRMEAIGTLAGGIAHDINNILTPIFAFTELTMAKLPEESDEHRNLTRVLDASKRARELVRQILTYSRQVKSTIDPIDIEPVIGEAVTLLDVTVPPTIELCTDLAGGPYYVLATPSQIHQIVMNLGTNASQAIGDASGRIDICLRRVRQEAGADGVLRQLSAGTYVELTIADTGIGMDQWVMEKIFDPFFTTKERGKGTGLGLSVVFGIVRSLGGAIDVQSQPHKGSTFRVFLPMANAPVLAPEPAATGKLTTGTGHILAVDDDESTLAALHATLEAGGYDVTTVRDSCAALDLYQKASSVFDLIIVDQVMPKMSGKQLAGHILQRTPNASIIMLSGFSEQLAPEDARRLGLRAFLHKPFDQTELLNTISHVLASARFNGDAQSNSGN